MERSQSFGLSDGKGVNPDRCILPQPLRRLPETVIGQETQIEPLGLPPQHRVLMCRPEVALYFGSDEVIAQIGDLSH